ncbi:MAG: extracellular solute-binding protein [Spirochaetaceae bacterium]|jgi:raffinose/stachyose/melibiose transport system substrate-binding protein|nr:extracellular solute-binding protein [Spirochaetaceae bacterium]
MKHVRTLVLWCAGAGLSLLLLSGCSKNQSNENKLIIFQSKVEITTQLEEAAKAYQQETGVEVEVWSTTGDDYFLQLRNRLANNQGPDLFNLRTDAEIGQMANYLENLGDLPVAQKIAADLLGKSGDTVIGIPYTIEAFGFVYNKGLIDPSKITGYDSFAAMLREQKARGINGAGLSQEAYFLIGHILNTPFAVQSDVRGFIDRLNKGEVKMADTPEFQEFARFMTAIRDNSYNPLEVNYDRECGDFATGKTAAIHQGNWCYSMFADYDVNFEMAFMPFPLGGNDRIAVGVPSWWCINSQTSAPKKQLARDFIEWLYTSETGQRYLYGEFQFIPLISGAGAGSLDPLSADASRYASAGKIIPWAFNFWPAGIIEVHLAPAAEQFFASRMSAEEFLVSLDNAWVEANK